jgi:NAD(P)H-dependent flavin oxidoreductase YrpB (nitropropane dioxygenase family)
MINYRPEMTDGVIVKGTEAGGHVKATRPLEEVVRDTVAELASIPVFGGNGPLLRRIL